MTISLLVLSILLQDSPTGPMEQGRGLTALFYQGKDAEIWSRFSDKMKQTHGKVESLTAFRELVATRAGAEASILDERVETANGLAVYSRVARFTKSADPLLVQWTLGAGGIVESFLVKPASAGSPKEAPTD